LDNTRIVEQTRTYNVAKRLQISHTQTNICKAKGEYDSVYQAVCPKLSSLPSSKQCTKQPNHCSTYSTTRIRRS